MSYYDAIAPGYQELYGDEQEKKLAIIKHYAKPKRTDRLLDVGCGNGLSTKIWDCIATGIDPSEKLLPKEPNFIKGEAENLPFEDNSFDYVISITAIQNFHDIEKALREIKRVGKKRFVLSWLKKSKNSDKILAKVRELWNIQKIILEDKDIICFI
jgi:ubiquinone/menaquinone biosynthesis C-methylase UbiE